MCPEKARIFWIEDDDISFRVQRKILELTGHTVVLSASSRAEVTARIPLMEGVGVQVVIVDGNLSEGDDSGRDGEAVTQEIKKAAPKVIVVGNASRKPIASADINCPKVEGATALAETVTRI